MKHLIVKSLPNFSKLRVKSSLTKLTCIFMISVLFCPFVLNGQSRESSQIFFTGIGQINRPSSPDSWTFSDAFIFIISDYGDFYQVEQFIIDGKFQSSHIYEYYKTITDENELKETKKFMHEEGFEYVYKDSNDDNAYLYSTEKLNEMARGMSGYIRLQLPDNTIAIFTLAKPSKNLFQRLIEIEVIE